MKLLLDTHIFIWSDEEPERIPQSQLSALEDETNELVSKFSAYAVKLLK